MSIASCQRCNRLFNKASSNLCPECIRKEEDAFEAVKLYLRSHQDASIEEISESVEVDEELVIKFMRDGRLVPSKKMTYPCEVCGAPIQSGKLCQTCIGQMANTIQDLKQSMAKDMKQNTIGYRSQRE